MFVLVLVLLLATKYNPPTAAPATQRDENHEIRQRLFTLSCWSSTDDDDDNHVFVAVESASPDPWGIDWVSEWMTCQHVTQSATSAPATAAVAVADDDGGDHLKARNFS